MLAFEELPRGRPSFVDCDALEHPAGDLYQEYLPIILAIARSSAASKEWEL